MTGNRISLSASLKSADTEEWIDIVFYRPIGYVVSLAAHRIKVTPNQITILSIFLGVFSGIAFYFPTIEGTVWGILFLIAANVMDSADGQLARMTKQTSAIGRWLDGAAGDFWFISIYLALGIRMNMDGYPWWIWIFLAATGYCHTKQAALADYYRTFHLMFLKNKKENEFQQSEFLREQFESKNWRKDFFPKFALMTYLNYTVGQERMTPRLQEFYSLLRKQQGDDIDESLRAEFRQLSKPLMKYTNILSFNTRAIVLFIAVIVHQPIIYFLFEITLLNLLLAYMWWRHEQICQHFYSKLFRYEV